MRTPIRPILATLPALLLAGCGTPSTRIASIQVVADSEANQRSATALDIVFVYDSATASLLPRTGPEWFEKRDALEAGLATGIDVVTVEVPPAMTLEPPLPKRHGKAIAVYCYANYIAPKGQPMGNLTPFKQMTIKLMPDTIVYAGN